VPVAAAASANVRHSPNRSADGNADPEPDPETVAHTICLRLLTVRARTEAELAGAMTARNVPDDAAARVLDRLRTVRLIDDAAFAVDFVNARRSERGLASRELSRQLRAKGVADDSITTALQGVDAEAERATARTLVERKLKSMSRLDSTVQTRRLVAMLARKGYPPGMAFEVVRDVLGAAAGELDREPEFD
jgi:regulatory protein